jgi:hypothetical protein
MSSEYMFCVGRGKVSQRERARIDRICRKYASRQAAFSNPTLPGDGPKYWFSVTNLGSGLDQKVAAQILEEVGEVKTMVCA